MQVYLELYHVDLDAGGKGHYTLDCRVTRLEVGEDRVRKDEMVATSFEFDTSAPRVQETFAVDISQLKPGNYEMSIEVHDTVSSQRKQRTRRFEILSDNR